MKDKINLISEIFSYPEKEFLKDREIEFVRLFINNYEKSLCSPYAFDYFNNLTPSEFFLNLKNLYKSAGLEISPDYNEREDHIVTLIEFLGYLIEIKTPENYLKKFFKNYLFWIKDFAQCIEQNTENEHYLKGAKLLKEIYNEFSENN